MYLINVTADNSELDDIPCLDQKNPNSVRLFNYDRKWLLDRFDEGLKIIKLDTPEPAFIEYIPAEKAWKPISAPGYIFVNQLFVPEIYASEWLKSILLHHCEIENKDKNGVVIMLGNDDFKQNRTFFLQRGYLEYAHLPNFTLLVKRFNPESPSPYFSMNFETETSHGQSHTITLKYADQSTFINFYIFQMGREFEDLGFEVILKKLETAKDARDSGTPYGTFGVFLDGNFLTHRLLNQKGIQELIGKQDLNIVFPEIKKSFNHPHSE